MSAFESHKNLLLLLGDDIVTDIAVRRAIENIRESRPELPIHIFYVQHKPNKGSVAAAEVQQNRIFHLWERDILNECLVQVDLEDGKQGALHTIFNGKSRNLRAVANKMDIPVETVPDINAPHFIERITREFPDAILINNRGFQKYRIEFIQACEDAGITLLNNHPGILGRADHTIRGVMSTPHARRLGKSQIGVTTHVIDPEYDAGPIVEVNAIPVDRDFSAFGSTMALVKPMREALESVVRQYLEDVNLAAKAVEQGNRNETVHYHSYFSPEEHEELRRQDVGLVDPQRDLEVILNHYHQDPSANRVSQVRKLVKAFVNAKMSSENLPLVYKGVVNGNNGNGRRVSHSGAQRTTPAVA